MINSGAVKSVKPKTQKILAAVGLLKNRAPARTSTRAWRQIINSIFVSSRVGSRGSKYFKKRERKEKHVNF